MSDNPVNLQKIATNVAQRAVDRLLESGEKIIKTYWARFKNRDVSTYAEYIVRKGSHVNSVRNLVYDNSRVSLDKIYIPTTIQTIYADEFLNDLCKPDHRPSSKARPIRPAKASAVTGPAGMGKSLFMKYAFFELQQIDHSRIPVFIEARRFNNTKIGDLENQICQDFSALGIDVLVEKFTTPCPRGCSLS
jgi:hypothetical protein